MSPILGIYASSQQGSRASSYESITTVTVGAGGTSTITFSSIPSTYTHLQIRGIARSTLAGVNPDNIAFRFNSDSGSNYSTHNLYATSFGSNVYAGAFTSLSYGYLPSAIPSAGSLSNDFCGFVIDILDYRNTSKNKTVRALSGWDENAVQSPNFYNRIQLSSSAWLSTSAITQIDFTNSANFAQYSSFALYGIKGA